MFCLFSCDTTAQKKNDLQRQNLKGKVKSVKQFSYEVVEKFGEITKGINIGWSEDDNSLSLYDDKGNLIEENLYNYDRILLLKYKNQYDDKGNLIEGNWYNPDGTLGFKSKYQYNDKGNKIEENWYDSDGKLIGKVKVQYDEKGNVIEETRYNSNGKLSSKSKYLYDDEGNKIEENWYNADGILGSKYKYQYKYDQQGNWTEQIEYENDIPQKIKERTIEYYD